MIFAIALITVYIAAFFIPNGVEEFALNPEKSSEFWRFITYPFVHLDIMHLVENIIGLVLITLIAIELKTAFSDFSSAYLSSGFLSILPVWIIMPFIALGASNAIFGGFGMISQETKKYNINGAAVAAIIGVLIFASSLASLFSYGIGSEQFNIDFKQSLSHLSGLIFGIGFFFLIRKIKPALAKRKRYALREAVYG